MNKYTRYGRAFLCLILPLVLAGCQWQVLSPAGYVAEEERMLILICIAVMLCVVIPVMVAIVMFACKYNAKNTSLEYLPDWGHSTKMEVFMWGIPVVIVTILGIITGYYAFKLEPSRNLSSSVAGIQQPLQINAVALDWKWLFIYPEYGVAAVNELYAPVNRQVFLQLSAQNAINAFWVPKLGTVLYAMPQMNSKLHLIANQEGVFPGLSANFSGDAFANMHFLWHSVKELEFNNWLNKIKQSGAPLSREDYLQLAKAPDAEDLAAKQKDSAIRYYTKLDNELYYRIVNGCVAQGKECNERLMWRDAASSLWGQLCSVFNADYVEK